MHRLSAVSGVRSHTERRDVASQVVDILYDVRYYFVPLSSFYRCLIAKSLIDTSPFGRNLGDVCKNLFVRYREMSRERYICAG